MNCCCPPWQHTGHLIFYISRQLDQHSEGVSPARASLVLCSKGLIAGLVEGILVLCGKRCYKILVCVHLINQCMMPFNTAGRFLWQVTSTAQCKTEGRDIMMFYLFILSRFLLQKAYRTQERINVLLRNQSRTPQRYCSAFIDCWHWPGPIVQPCLLSCFLAFFLSLCCLFLLRLLAMWPVIKSGEGARNVFFCFLFSPNSSKIKIKWKDRQLFYLAAIDLSTRAICLAEELLVCQISAVQIDVVIWGVVSLGKGRMWDVGLLFCDKVLKFISAGNDDSQGRKIRNHHPEKYQEN